MISFATCINVSEKNIILKRKSNSIFHIVFLENMFENAFCLKNEYLTLITYLFLSIFITPQKYTNKTFRTNCLLPLREQKQHFCRFVCKFECCTMPRVILSDALKYVSMFNFVLQSLSSISCTTILCVLIHKSTYRHVFKYVM